MRYSEEYQIIKSFYGDRCAKRSGVPLMNHIEEGYDLLTHIDASDEVIGAFFIHPIVQNDEPIDVSWSKSFELACEYKLFANAYLCRPETDHITTPEMLHEHLLEKCGGVMSAGCHLLLIADKEQNLKDFMIYHHGTHERSAQLYRYFNVWLDYLYEVYYKYAEIS